MRSRHFSRDLAVKEGPLSVCSEHGSRGGDPMGTV